MFDFFKKKKKPTEKLSHTDYNIIFDNQIVEDTQIEVIEIGELNLPTGKISVCDPLAYPDIPPFKNKVVPGKYPVKLYQAKTEDMGDRITLAKLEFSSKKADKWVLALRDDENLADLTEDNDFFGFPVDAGLGSFMDYETALEYNRFVLQFIKDNPDGNIYDDLFADEFQKNAKPNECGDWINYSLPDTNLNITMFSSGYGDGMYPAYWGMTNDNEIVSLVIDFFVLLLPEEDEE